MMTLRQDVKVHMFDLQNVINSIRELAVMIEDHVNECIGQLDLRKEYSDGGSLGPNQDLELWKEIIDIIHDDLEDSIVKCDDIVQVLERLQRDCVKTEDDMSNEILLIRDKLTNSSKAK